MKKKARARKAKQTDRSYDWLPIESWLVPSFRFTHVHGIARVFLVLEIFLSVCVVLGTLLFAMMRLVS